MLSKAPRQSGNSNNNIVDRMAAMTGSVTTSKAPVLTGLEADDDDIKF
jgi:hypothetical protein